MNVIGVKNVNKRFKRVQALSSINLDVRKGEIFGLIGPDGSGKSTLMKIIAGVLLPDSGSVYVLGEDVVNKPESVKKKLAFMPQGIGQNLYMDLTVEENIDFSATIKGLNIEEKQQLKERLLLITKLFPFKDRLARQLSGGMQQKLGLCCSIISSPEVLVLDEPTTGVDPVSRRELWDLMYEFAEGGMTILISTAYMLEAERCHKIAIMQDGRIIKTGSVDKILADYESIENFFKTLNKKTEDVKVVLPDIPPKENNSIKVKGLTKYFGDFCAVDNVSFYVKEGEIFGLLGPNGAGKTTTIKMLVGLLKPSSGRIETVSKKDIGYMSQKFSLYKDLTVEENIDFYMAIYSIPHRERKIRKAWILEISGLEKYRDELTHRLPWGMKQRLALGCSFIHFPSVLFLDEPTSGVDPWGREQFWRIIHKLSQEKNITVIVTTHHLIEAHYCHRLALMNNGRIVALGTPDELIENAKRLQGDMFEIRTEQLKRAKDLLLARGIYTYYYGKALKVWDHIDLDTLKEILVSANITADVRPKDINMEDAFVLYSKDEAIPFYIHSP